jgi:ligand-binding sensor domain-containing protein/two-component sensor histidine kinase
MMITFEPMTSKGSIFFGVLLLIAQANQPCIAQINEADYLLHTHKDGLAHSYITGIVQDEKGYIWISSMQGLSRYDGTEYFPVSIRQFKCTDEYGHVWRMKYFGNNEIGITTGNGAYCFNSQTLNYKSFIVPPLFGSNQTFNKCRDLEKINDSLYASSTGTGFYIFRKDGSIKIRKDAFTSQQLGNEWFQFGGTVQRFADGTVLQENQQNYYLFSPGNNLVRELTDPKQPGRIKQFLLPNPEPRTRFFPNKYTGKGLFVFNREKNTLDLLSDLHHPELLQSLPLPFSVQNEINWQSDLYYLGDTTFTVSITGRGFFLFRYNTHTNRVSVDPTRHFSSYVVNAVFCDRSNNLWIGTGRGLLRPVKKNIKNRVFDLQAASGLAQPFFIRAIYADSAYIFTGGRMQSGLLLLDPFTKELKRKLSFSSIHNDCNSIGTIIPAPTGKDTLWIGTDHGLLWFNKKTLAFGKLNYYQLPDWVANYSISYCMTDSRGNPWFRTNATNRVFFFNTADRVFQVINAKTAGPLFRIAVCFGMGEDEDGNIWLGGDGLCRWNRKTELVDSLLYNMPGLETEYISYNIFETDSLHNLWMTVAPGILRWNPKTGEKKLYTANDGLPHNIVFAYPAPDKNHLFVHTFKGMGWLDKRTGKSIVFSERDGLPEIGNPRLVAHCYSNYTREHLFSYDNLLVALPLNFEKTSPPPQSLNISMLHIYHDTVLFHPYENTELKYYQNDLGICFNAVNFLDPENHAFAYRLVGPNEPSDHGGHWINTGRQSTIYLNDLSPGHYRFQIKLTALNRRWPHMVREIGFTIRPPYWKQTWFLILAGSLLASLLMIAYRARIRNIRQKANLDKLLAQTEMKALHAQMNPHFVFNCLNSINEMILLNENAQASHYLSKFAYLIRTTLDHSTKEWVSLKQTIDYLQRYIELEKIRRNDFKFVVETDKSLNENETFLPPMLIQPLLENAIWHSKTREKQLEIHTRFIRQNGQLLCEVSDNGIGIDEALRSKEQNKLHKSIGISNIRQRIRLLNEKYNLESELVLEDRKGSMHTGTLAILRLPLKTTDL